jgi:hypothetical protein
LRSLEAAAAAGPVAPLRQGSVRQLAAAAALEAASDYIPPALASSSIGHEELNQLMVRRERRREGRLQGMAARAIHTPAHGMRYGDVAARPDLGCFCRASHSAVLGSDV